MRSLEIETWVLRVIGQVERGAHAEDGLVELKSKWPSPETAARQIAALANAARGEPVLWIIGVDETTGVCGADPAELANWFSTVRSRFDQVYPEVQDLNVPASGQTVVALLFQTDRAPYLVKNSAFGSVKGDAVEWEIPWREGRKTRTANREALLRMLGPLVQLPDVECLSCSLSVRDEPHKDGGSYQRWYFDASLYVVPRGEALVIPFHRCVLTAAFEGGASIDNWPTLRLTPPYSIRMAGREMGSRVDSLTVESSSAEVIIQGPGKVQVMADVTNPLASFRLDGSVSIALRLNAIGANAASVLTVELTPKGPKNASKAEWVFDPS